VLPQAHAERSMCGWWAETLRRVAYAPEHAAEAHMAAAHLGSEEHRAAKQASLALTLTLTRTLTLTLTPNPNPNPKPNHDPNP
jgi:hypothetical protein